METLQTDDISDKELIKILMAKISDQEKDISRMKHIINEKLTDLYNRTENSSGNNPPKPIILKNYFEF